MTFTDSGNDELSLASPLTGGSGSPKKPSPSSYPARTPEMDLRIAKHESGHICCGKAFGFPVAFATIVPTDGYGGMVSANADRSFLATPDHVADLCAKVRPLMPQVGQPRIDAAEFYTHAHFRIIVLLAGTESERLFHTADPPLQANHDLEEAKVFAAIICSPAAVPAFIEFGKAEARAILDDHRHIALALARALVANRTLDGDQIDSVISDAVFAKAIDNEHLRRAEWQRTIANSGTYKVNKT